MQMYPLGIDRLHVVRVKDCEHGVELGVSVACLYKTSIDRSVVFST